MRRLTLVAAFALGSIAATASAQPRVAVGGPRAPERRAESNALRAQLGVPLAARLLVSDDLATRIRGIERLGAIGTTEAIDALVDAMDQGSIAARDPRARLTAVRVLAGEAKRDNVRQLLLREVTESGGSDALRAQQPLAAVVRATAALVLARSGDRKAVGALVGVALTGASADVAVHALATFPPPSLEPFLEGRKQLTAPLATLLADLGDLRAIERLRGMLAESDQAAKIAGGVALARMSDPASLPLAREWVKKSDPRLRRAAADIFLALDARAEADAAVIALLESDVSREEGLRLALVAPSPAFGPVLVKLLATLTGDQRDRALAALGRARLVKPLVPLLESPSTALAAAFAIATLPGAEAREALEHAIEGEKAKQGDARRLFARAGVVRGLVLDDPPAGLNDKLRAMFASNVPADRAAGAFGLTALGVMSVDDVLRAACKSGPDDRARLSCDAGASAAARGTLALPDGASSLTALMPWLERAAVIDPTTPTSDAIALGAALLAAPDGGDLPTSTLGAWAEAGGPLAPLAARALAARDDEAIRGRIRRLLESSDPVVRAHVAVGLGRDPEPSAVSLLTTAYRFEEDATVRRAVVRGLSRRSEVQRTATLTLARDLDPDDETRALARRALEGYVLDPGPRPALGVEPRRNVAWVVVEPVSLGETPKPPPTIPNTAPVPDGAEPRPGEAPRRAARLVRADGIAVPAVADPDGALLVPGLPPGLASLLVGRPLAR